MRIPKPRVEPAAHGKRGIRGFTMVELLISASVVGVMFVSLYAGMSTGFTVIQLARENLRASQILQEKMETIRLYTWDQVNKPGFIPGTFVEPFYDAIPVGGQYSTNSFSSGLLYTGKVSIASAPVTEAYSNELRQVNISIHWKSAKVLRTREMTTFVTRNGLQNYIY